MKKIRRFALLFTMAIATVSKAQLPDASALAFGAREDVEQASLSPDGTQIAYLTPFNGIGSVLVVRGVEDGAKPRLVIASDGKPERLKYCHWVSNLRLVCTVYGITEVDSRRIPFTRLFGVDTDRKNVRQLSTKQNTYSRGMQLGGGDVVDWLPQEDGSVLMSRNYIPDDHTGSLLGSTREGLGVDRVDTRSNATRTVEPPKPKAAEYLTDGKGVVRIYRRDETTDSGMATGLSTYFFRKTGSREWEQLSQFNDKTEQGFAPLAVDPALNIAYGFKRVNGRNALYSITLDGLAQSKLLVDRPDVDIDDLVQIGRSNRVIGASYQTDKRSMVFFDTALERLANSLRKAVPKQPAIRIVDSSLDERKLLIFAGSDDDSGVYYLFDRDKHDLHVLFPARPQLIDRALAKMTSITYRATDGTMIPAYLTFPPGKENGKGLPSIVLPHGGPASRDEWGFDWLPQYYASQGYAVIQPQFRGSAGYGEAWFQKNGFISWRIAIGDVTDAGRWMIKQGIADPAKLAVVGWSYGGYAALQSAVLAPDLFKAVVAIAPVTDLAMLKNESNGWTDALLRRDFIGSGAHITDGSPAQNAQKIKVPVLLVHGTMDANVGYNQSTFMASKLRGAGGKVELISFPGLDHQLEDSAARATLLGRSKTFLEAALGK